MSHPTKALISREAAVSVHPHTVLPYRHTTVVAAPERFIEGWGSPLDAHTRFITRMALLVILGIAVVIGGLAVLAAELRSPPPPPPVIVEAPPAPAPVIVMPPQPAVPPRPLSHCVLFGLLCYDTPGG